MESIARSVVRWRRYVLTAARWGRFARIRCAVWLLAFSQYAKQLAPCGGGRCYVLTAARWGRVARIRCAVWLLAFSQYAKQCAPPIPPQGGATAHTPIPNFATHNALRSTKFAKHKIQLFALKIEIYAKRNGKHNTTRKDMSCMFGVDSHGRKTVSILR